MNKGIKIGIIVAFSFLLLIGYFLFQNSKSTPDLIMNAEITRDEVGIYLTNIQKQEEQIFQYVSEENVELANMKTHSEEFRYGDKKGVIEFVLAAIMMKDVDLFLQSFDPYVISSDIHSSPEKDKNLVLTNFMNQISRNGQLTELGYTDVKGMIGDTSNTANLTFYYSDGIKVTTPISFAKFEDLHHGGEIYAISTSVLDIIHEIENTVK